MLLAAIAGLTITTPLLLLLRAAEMGRRRCSGGSARAQGARPVITDRCGRCAPRPWWSYGSGSCGEGPARACGGHADRHTRDRLDYSASGHASAWGDFSLAQLIDDLHIASTAIWVGGLLVLATSARPLLLTGHDRAYALETAKRLSRLAGLALLCVVLTGIY